MKKFLIPAFATIFILFACKNTAEKEQKEENTPNESHTPALPATVTLCFLTTGEDITRGDRVIRDSTILNLKIKDKKVTGLFNWFPAEKDGRSGTIEGTLNGDIVKGEYTFTQEGMTETQDIRIEMAERQVRIITNPGKQGEFVLTADKVECED